MNLEKNIPQKIIYEIKGGGIEKSICCYTTNAFEKIAWQITDKCNLSCPYCFTPSNKHLDLAVEQNLQILNKVKQLFPYKSKILFAGREPLLYDGIEDILKAASELFFDCSISSSGELITINKIIKMKDAGLSKINFTVNSFSQSNNSFSRPGSNIKETLKAIQISKKHNISSSVNINIMKSTLIDLPETLKVIINLGVKNIKLGFLHPNKSGYTLGQEFSKNTVDYIQKILSKYDLTPLTIKIIAPPTNVSCFKLKECPVKKGFISILPNGEITGCNIFPEIFRQKE